MLKRGSVLLTMVLGAAVLVPGGAQARKLAREPEPVVTWNTSIQVSELKLSRVAIVPTVLPVPLADGEYWRKVNHEIMAGLFKARGFDVVDYEASVKAATQTGLLLPNAKFDKTRYAETADALNVDLLIVPNYVVYYALQAGFLSTEHRYLGLATLSLYSREKDDFLARIDAAEKSGWTQYLFLEQIPCVNIVYMVATCGARARTAEEWWRLAFKKTCDRALESFFAVYPQASK